MSKKSLNNDTNLHRSHKTDTYANFINNLTKQGVLYDERDLSKLAKTFSTKAHKVQKEIDLFNQAISTYPIMTMIYLWVQSIDRKKVLGEKYLSMMWELIENDIIPHMCSDRTPITFAEYASLSSAIVDKIRCFEDWSIDKQEIMVEFYCEFSRWLSTQTFNLIPFATDTDKEITNLRKIPFETYVKFLIALEPRERIMTKIFYLGGSVALEDVLSINIEDIDYKNSTIRLGDERINFPPHLIIDLKRYVGDKKKGFVFRGKQNDRINHTVPYRALKAIAVKFGFGADFTFKEFVKNQ